MKALTDSDYKNIILRRDPRYDGRFYFGVTTTKIYCRPVCPARPKTENMVVFKSPSEAEKAGFRACLRCRPDLAPDCKRLTSSETIIKSGLHLIEEMADDKQGVEFMAQTLGISTRHLRRVFEKHLGASPIDIIQTRRLHLAKQLILETGQPIGEIAFATGFKSIRRFNEAFKTFYRMPPSEFRKKRVLQNQIKEDITLKLMVRKPYDFASILSFLKRHAAHGIENVGDDFYERYVPDQQSYSTVRVTINKKQDALQVSLKNCKLVQISQILVKLRRLFDVDHNPAHLPQILSTRQAGVRVPGSFEPFEVAVSIILSQLVSIKQATGKLADLIRQFGAPINGNTIYRFPSPAELMAAEIESIGITRTKAGAIRALSSMVHNTELHFSYSPGLEETRKQLLSIKGIGPWTSEMIMMRCFSDADALPESDLIVKRALDQNLVDEEVWKTNRSYMTHHIWNEFAETLSKRKST